MRILFVLKRRVYNEHYATSYGLMNSANQVAFSLTEHGHDCKVVVVTDGNGIDREVYNFKPDMVIIEALWCPTYKLKELIELPRYSHIKWIVRIHSDAGFLAAETLAFKYIDEYIALKKDNLYIAPNNKRFKDNLEKATKYDFTYLPNVINNSYSFVPKKEHHVINIGCFGALRILKNQLYQAICAMNAADRLGKRLDFHINVNPKNEINPVFENLTRLFEASHHNLVVHNWVEHDEFVDLIRMMDVGLQLSYTESFNIVAADFISNGIPIAVSNAIELAPCFYKTSTVNYDETISKIVSLYEHRNGFFRNYIAQRKLQKINKNNLHEWLKFLSEV